MTEYREEERSTASAEDAEERAKAHGRSCGESGGGIDGPEEVGKRLLDYVKSWLSDQKILSGVKIRKTSTIFHQTGRLLHEQNQQALSTCVLRSADRLHQLSDYLEDRPLEEIPDDVSRLAHDKPWMFMGGSIVLGVLLARYILTTPPKRPGRNTEAPDRKTTR